MATAMLRTLAALLLLATPADAAVLRAQTTLATAQVRIADLFDDAGAAATQILGPSPAPGGRIVVESRQLAAIARQFGIDWRPASPADRIVLDRPGRMMPREDLLSALRAALSALGASDDAELLLPALAPPLIPLGIAAQAAVEAVELDSPTGRFTAQLAISADGMDTLRLRVAGTLQEMVEIPAPLRKLAAGSVLRADDLTLLRLPANRVRGEVARSLDQAIGQAVRRTLLPGQPLALADLARPIAVAKGARVAMQLSAPGLQLSAQGQALEAGSVGDRIQVLNPASRAIVEAEVIGRDRVRVAPGSAPLQPAGTATFGAAQVALR